MSEATGDNGKQTRTFASKLDRGRERFLAHAIEHSLETGRRTPEDFIRHFPPRAIMEGLAQQPKLRGAILVLTTGLKPKISEKKSWESAGEDLQIALDEHETDAETIVTVFEPDDRVRYLDAKKIWQFLVEGDFWKASLTDKQAHELAKDNIAFMLERALADRLLTHRDVVEGITVAEIAKRLPKAELGKIIEGALTKAKANSPFTEVDLLKEMPPFVIVEYVPLPHIFETVIQPKIAQAHEYVAPPAAAAADAGPTSAATAAFIDSLPPASQDWVDASQNDARGESEPPEVSDDDDDEISDEDFA
jgi:hypothetical protein